MSQLMVILSKETFGQHLISNGAKIMAIEVKSSGTGKHESLSEFEKIF